jgi:hypothetical protein
VARRPGQEAARLYEAAAHFVAQGLGRNGSILNDTGAKDLRLSIPCKLFHLTGGHAGRA